MLWLQQEQKRKESIAEKSPRKDLFLKFQVMMAFRYVQKVLKVSGLN